MFTKLQLSADEGWTGLGNPWCTAERTSRHPAERSDGGTVKDALT